MAQWLLVIAWALGASAQSLFQFESDDYISYRTVSLLLSNFRNLELTRCLASETYDY